MQTPAVLQDASPAPVHDRAARGVLSACLAPLDASSDFAALTRGYDWAAFQSPHWLKTWFSVFARQGEVEGFWLSLNDGEGKPVLALPLIRRQDKGLRVLECPDLGVSDYNAPLLHGAEGAALHAPADLWRVILSALPPADLLRLDRMPQMIGARQNPLAQHFLSLPSRMSGWAVDMGADWESYYASLSPKMREKLGKARRRFARSNGTMRMAQTGEDAATLLSRIETLQAERIREKGLDYHLDDPKIAHFYRELAASGVPEGHVVMAALEAEGEIVGANFGICSNGRVTYLRVANLFGPWAPFALGLLTTEHLMQSAHTRGVRIFDFAMGDYDYKKRFRTEAMPLCDLKIPLSYRGWPDMLIWQARRRLASIGWLKSLYARLKGQAPAAQKRTDESDA